MYPDDDPSVSVTPLDDRAADALLAGDDTGLTGGWSEVARVLAPLRELPATTRPTPELLDRMQAATGSRRVPAPVWRRPRTVLAELAAAATALLAFGGLAAANALPAEMQRFVSHALDHVGISVPLPDDHPSIVPGHGGGEGRGRAGSNGDKGAEAGGAGGEGTGAADTSPGATAPGNGRGGSPD